jgi:AP-3 complex subunit beta
VNRECFPGASSGVLEIKSILTCLILLLLRKPCFINWPFLQVFLCAEGEDLWSFKRVLSYVLELAECDLNYDVRDRARFIKKILSCNLGSQGLEEEINHLPQNKEPSRVIAEHIFGGQMKPVSPEPMNLRFYLPGSLSQIVLHAAPGYEPLPKPHSLLLDDFDLSNVDKGSNTLERARNSESYDTDDPESVSGSLDQETASNYSSEHSITHSSVSDGSDETDSVNEGDDNDDPLIQISDVGNACENEKGVSQSGSADLGELISKRGLELWLNDQPGLSNMSTSEQSQVCGSTARISIRDIGHQIKTKSYTLLDPANGNGLKVDYSFSSEVSNVALHLVGVEVHFKNCSSEPMSNIILEDEDSSKGSNSADQTLVATDR